jgi:dihydroxyacetone kinase-like predicted kinase
VVAVTRAPGLARVLESFGARVVRPQHGSRPSVGEIAGGVIAAGTPQVIVLPNDRDALLAAGQAASLARSVSLRVIPTRNAAEGIAALVAFDAEADLDANAARMEQEAAALRSFTVFTAARDSVVDGVAVARGEILALDAERRLLARGEDITSTTLGALTGYDDFELVTVYCGRGQGSGICSDLGLRIEAAYPGVETEVVHGGQLHDHLLVAVE